MHAASSAIRYCHVVLVLSILCGVRSSSMVAHAGPPLGCGDPGTGDCFEPGFSPYCEDVCGGRSCPGCCKLVCAADPFCCDEEVGSWDGFCAVEAETLCSCDPDEDVPPNDDCTSAIAVQLGDTEISNICATVGGPEHADLECSDGPAGLEGMGFDVWFTYESSFWGSLSVSTCNQLDPGWDSQLAVYEGCDCSDLSDPPLGCNQDFLGCAHGTSLLTVSVEHGACYTIRVGSSVLGPFGSGTMTLTPLPCPDFDGDGGVGPFDLATLLFYWGPCGDCPADLNGDGVVGSFDLALLLGAWGPC
ncbi:MAG: hypothetical protein IH895_10410 [Planctomycetes bacterium]|nr:hypothetical protein [Planctomycetota bacterium]